jgi:hypothetical protein
VAPELLLWSVPADPEIPRELHGSRVVFVGAVYAGPAGEAEPTLAPLRSLGTPLLDMSGPLSYVAAQSGADEAFPAGGRYYMKSHFLDELTDTGIDTLLEWYARRPTPETLVAIRTLGGCPGWRRRERLCAPVGEIQPEHRRHVGRSRDGRGRYRMGPFDVGGDATVLERGRVSQLLGARR